MAKSSNTLQTYSRFFTISPPSYRNEGRHSTTDYSLLKLYQMHIMYATWECQRLVIKMILNLLDNLQVFVIKLFTYSYIKSRI